MLSFLVDPRLYNLGVVRWRISGKELSVLESYLEERVVDASNLAEEEK